MVGERHARQRENSGNTEYRQQPARGIKSFHDRFPQGLFSKKASSPRGSSSPKKALFSKRFLFSKEGALLQEGLFCTACRPCRTADFTARIAVAQADRRADACHHSEVIVSRPDHNPPIMAGPVEIEQRR